MTYHQALDVVNDFHHLVLKSAPNNRVAHQVLSDVIPVRVWDGITPDELNLTLVSAIGEVIRFTDDHIHFLETTQEVISLQDITYDQHYPSPYLPQRQVPRPTI